MKIPFISIKMAKESIQERLKHIRKQLGKTQQQMADVLDILQSSYSQIEGTGKSDITVKHIITLAEQLNVNPNFILLGELPVFRRDVVADMDFSTDGTRTFDVHGDDMYPTLMHGDVVSCVQVKDYKNINDSHIYVLVTKNKATIIGHLQPGFSGVYVIPQNQAVAKSKLIEHGEIGEIWEVKLRITAFLMQFSKP